MNRTWVHRLVPLLVLWAQGVGSFGMAAAELTVGDRDILVAAMICRFIDPRQTAFPPAKTGEGAPAGSGEFRIAVLDDDGLADRLEDVIKAFDPNATDRRRRPPVAQPLRVVRARRLEDLRQCQVAVLSSKSARWQAALTSLARQPVLTIGDDGAFRSKGGMIQLRESSQRGEGIRYQFEVNMKAARDAGISFSLDLVNLSLNRGR